MNRIMSHRSLPVFLVLIATMFIYSKALKGQNIRVGAYAMPAIPVGNFGDIYGFSFGGKISGSYFFNEHISVGFEAAYLSFPRSFGRLEYFNLIPWQFTAAYHAAISDELYYFVGTGTGLYLDIDPYQDYGADVSSSRQIRGGFIISPRVGISKQVTEKLNINVATSYSIFGENSWGSFIAVDIGVSYLLWE